MTRAGLFWMTWKLCHHFIKHARNDEAQKIDPDRAVELFMKGMRGFLVVEKPLSQLEPKPSAEKAQSKKAKFTQSRVAQACTGLVPTESRECNKIYQKCVFDEHKHKDKERRFGRSFEWA